MCCCLFYIDPISCFAGAKQWKDISETTKVLSYVINDQTCFSFLSAPKNFYRKSVPIFHCVMLFSVVPSSVECLIVDVLQVSNPCQKNYARHVYCLRELPMHTMEMLL